MAGYQGRNTLVWCAVSVATLGVAAAMAGCSSSATKAAGGSPSGHSSSIGKPDAAQALAAAPGAVTAAKTIAVDGTGTRGGQKVHITEALDYSGTFKGHRDVTVTGGTPKDPTETVPYDSGAIVVGDDEYDLAGSLVGAKSPADEAVIVKALYGRHWVLKSSASGNDASGAMEPWLVIGIAGEASEDDMKKSLTALLTSGLVVSDGTPAGASGTFHYTATLDETTLKATKYTAEQQDDLRQALGTENVGTEEIDLWVAPSGLPTEITFTEASSDVKPSGPSDDGTARFTWGTAVGVAAPPASDQVGMADLNNAFLSVTGQ